MKKVKILVMLVVVAVLAMVMWAAPAQAARIFIDFGKPGDYAANLSPDTSGRYWNQGSTTEVLDQWGQLKDFPDTGFILTNAVDEDNVATTVDVNILDGLRFTSMNIGGLTSSTITDWDANVTRDSWWIRTADGTIPMRLEGLGANEIWDLTFYGSYDGGDGVSRRMDVTIGATTQTYDAAPLEGMTTFTGVTADANGYITVDFACDVDGTYAYLSGMEIVLVPEPATLAVLSLGGLFTLLARRRRA